MLKSYIRRLISARKEVGRLEGQLSPEERAELATFDRHFAAMQSVVKGETSIDSDTLDVFLAAYRAGHQLAEMREQPDDDGGSDSSDVIVAVFDEFWDVLFRTYRIHTSNAGIFNDIRTGHASTIARVRSIFPKFLKKEGVK